MINYELLWNEKSVGKVKKLASSQWMITYDTGWLLPLGCFNHNVRSSELAKSKAEKKAYTELLPHMIQDLIPQGENLKAILDRDGISSSDDVIGTVLAQNELFLSGFMISKNPERKNPGVLSLDGRLNDFVEDGTFVGRAQQMPEFSMENQKQVRSIITNAQSTQMSGVQCKVPMHLDKNGDISPAVEKPFTHILKLPTYAVADPTASQGALEWLGLELARAGGINTVDCAMAEVGSGRTIGLLVERFDIPVNDMDCPLIMTETLRSAMGEEGKFATTFERAGKAILSLSTSKDEDVREYFRQVCGALFGENSDFHLQNISLIEVVDPMQDRYESIRLAPAYDITNGGFLLGEEVTMASETMPMALGLTEKNQKQFDIEISDLLDLAKTISIPEDEARQIAFDTAQGMYRRALEIYENPPALLKDARHKAVLHNVEVACGRLCKITKEYFPDVDARPGPKFRAS
jgi:serine/threonine-protein kinase HipA